MLAFFWLQAQSHNPTVHELVLSPWNCAAGLEGDYWGCPFAPRLVLLECSLQGYHMFMVMVTESTRLPAFPQAAGRVLLQPPEAILTCLQLPPIAQVDLGVIGATCPLSAAGTMKGSTASTA